VPQYTLMPGDTWHDHSEPIDADLRERRQHGAQLQHRDLLKGNMRRIATTTALILLVSAAFAEGGPPPSSHLRGWDYPNVHYNFGGVMLPSTFAGGGRGIEMINVSGGCYVNGSPISISGSPATTSSIGGVYAGAAPTGPFLHGFTSGAGEPIFDTLPSRTLLANLGYTPLNPANNLFDVASASTARTNLRLGTTSTQNTGTSGAAIPLLNAANSWSNKQTFANSDIALLESSTGATQRCSTLFIESGLRGF
jgi:hypothetical protein